MISVFGALKTQKIVTIIVITIFERYRRPFGTITIHEHASIIASVFAMRAGIVGENNISSINRRIYCVHGHNGMDIQIDDWSTI